MKGIYVIYDLKAGAALSGLLLHRADAAAIRQFADIASDPQTMIARHPEDYELRILGVFADESCAIHALADTADEKYRVILTGAAWKASKDAAHAATTTNDPRQLDIEVDIPRSNR